MSNGYVVALTSILVGASFTFGQAQDAPPPPQSRETVQGPSCGIWDGLKSTLFGDFDQKSQWIFAADAEYVLWFLANSPNSTVLASTDFLGRPTTMILGGLGDAEHEGKEPGSGARFTIGFWQIEDNPWVPGGIRDLGGEARFFFVGQHSGNFRNDSSPNLVRPFFDLNDRQELGFPVAFPGLATGSLAAHSQVDVWGMEANLWKNIYYNHPGTTFCVDMMVGFRHLSADHEFEIGSISVFNPNLAAFPPYAGFAGNRLQVFDSFATHSRFFGGQVGIDSRWWVMEKLTIQGDFRLGLGATSEDLNIVGAQVRTFANGTAAFSNGGLLALPSNIGHFHRDKFAQVPELDFKLVSPILNHLTLSAGFSALYWSRILRPAQQIDRDIDITQIPNFPPAAGAVPTGLARPGVPFKQSDLWVLGISIGVEFTW